MKKLRLYLFSGIIWLLAMGSLLGVHFFLKEKPRPPKESAEKKVFFAGLTDDLKIAIRRYENAVIRLGDKKLHLIGRDFENDEEKLLEDGMILLKKIDFLIDDPVALERRMMASEAFRKLNNAEKLCYADGYATILYREGRYLLAINAQVYYVPSTDP